MAHRNVARLSFLAVSLLACLAGGCRRTPVYATVEGTVRDSCGGPPMVGIPVRMSGTSYRTGKHSSSDLGSTTTDSSGHFSLQYDTDYDDNLRLHFGEPGFSVDLAGRIGIQNLGLVTRYVITESRIDAQFAGNIGLSDTLIIGIPGQQPQFVYPVVPGIITLRTPNGSRIDWQPFTETAIYAFGRAAYDSVGTAYNNGAAGAVPKISLFHAEQCVPVDTAFTFVKP